MPRILAIDYGIKRTGIAVTDEMQMIAFGLTTIPSETAIAFLKDYFSKEKALGAAAWMRRKHGGKFSAYKCAFCDGYHVGRSRTREEALNRTP